MIVELVGKPVVNWEKDSRDASEQEENLFSHEASR
jgi:hypothetical protein